MKLNVMTFNTQHCENFKTKKIDFDCIADVILQFSPDIVGLNEMRMDGVNPEYTDQIPELARKGRYPNWYFAKALDVGGQNPYGNGFLSRYPIISAETIPVPDPVEKKYTGHYETRCLLHAKIDIPGGLDVFVIHFGLNPDEQANAVKTVVKNITAQRCILMGDFNVLPENPVLETIRERMYDTAVLFKKELFSFPSDKPNIKIDYIFTSKDIKVLSADIPQIVASDHCPYIASVEI